MTETLDKAIQRLDKQIEKPKEEWLKCGFTGQLCNKEECGLWIVTYQRCSFVSIAKALDITASILDDRMGEPAT